MGPLISLSSDRRLISNSALRGFIESKFDAKSRNINGEVIQLLFPRNLKTAII